MRIPDGQNTLSYTQYLEAIAGGVDTIGTVYYVDANAGNDSDDGLSWQYAFKTLTVALLASHTDIASGATGWASRNRIYYKGDNAEASAEDIVALADKTDVIGVGSYDARPRPMLIGNHTVVGSYLGCRFFNMGFASPVAGGVVMTLPAGCAHTEFHGCVFDGSSTTKATKGLLATAVRKLNVLGCDFIGKFSNTAIDIGAGAGNAMRIIGNFIESGAKGITVSSTYTCATQIGVIQDNTFDVVTLLVDENSNDVMVGGNRGRTQADGTVALTIDYNAVMAYDNIFAHSAGVSQYPVLVTIPT